MLLLGAVLSGCAVGHIRPDGTSTCLVMGQAQCERSADGSVRVQGGILSGNATQVLTAIIAGIVGYLTHGAL